MKDQSQPQSKPKRLIKKSYLKCIRNSVGSKMFRNFYLELDDNVFDATKNGELSCAFYVSGLLVIFQLIKTIHGTVDGTIKDLEESGWVKTNQPTPGSVIIWEATLNGEDCNEHIGFYVGRDKAISNSSTKKKIIMHNWTYDNIRKVKAIYSNPILTK